MIRGGIARFVFVGSVMGIPAAFGQVSAPSVGLLASADGSEVRPVMGVLGASSVAAPLVLPAGAGPIYLAPGGQWALLRQGDGPLAALAMSPAATGSPQVIGHAFAAPDLVSFSPTGKSAALFSNAANTVQVLTGIDQNPQVAYQASLSGLAAPQAIAVSDDSAELLVLAKDGTVSLLYGGLTPQPLLSASLTSAIAFLPNQSAAVLVDGAAGSASLLGGLADFPHVQGISSNLALTTGQVFAQTSRDGKSAIAVAAAGTSAYRIDLVSGDTQRVTLPSAATRLDRLLLGESFVFSAEPGQSAWLLAGDGPNLEAVFAVNVPSAGPTPTQGAPDQSGSAASLLGERGRACRQDNRICNPGQVQPRANRVLDY